MICVFRTDSTDLFKGKPISDSQSPRMMRLEARLFNNKWDQMGSIDTLIRPDGWVPNAGATATHGITERQCTLYGIRARAALAVLVDMARASKEIVAFSLPFHSGVVEVEIHRLRAPPDDWKRGGLQRTCLMQVTASKINMGKSLSLEAAWPLMFPDRAMPSKMDATVEILKEIRLMKRFG